MGKVSITLMLGSENVICNNCRTAFLIDVSDAIRLAAGGEANVSG